METIKDIFDLLSYNIEILYAAENTLQDALPSLIEKANHHSLKNALNHHLKLSDEQKKRLKSIAEILNKKPNGSAANIVDFSLKQNNKGIAGLLEEADELMHVDLSEEVMDAAIISVVQKLEHYEICSYGTALALAKQLNLHKITALLNETLQEEYDANDILTALATSALNKEALPDGFDATNIVSTKDDTNVAEDDRKLEDTADEESERTINSPGGRAGTSHRGYGTGESRGH